MNKSLKKIENALDALKAENTARRDVLNRQALTVMAKRLDKSKVLTDLVSKLESSSDLTSDGEYPARFLRFSPSDFIDTDSAFQREVFSTYMQDSHCIHVEYETDCLVLSEGPCIVINEDGDIYDQDSGKFIAKRKDYLRDNETEDHQVRNQLIENYMESTGYFPSVVSWDRYNNIFYVNTTGK